ncbi:MAG: glycosyltransferase family 39 protein, partial [Vicinamibacteria bacterium]
MSRAPSSTERLALAGIVVLALALRLVGLSAGLRHPPHNDERVFVENAHRMAAERSLDHGFYEYPGLAFFLLAPVEGAFGETPPGPRAYYAARALVAVTGGLVCLLLFRLGSGIAGPGAGLVAALFGAVSPVAVETAHQFRPDVLLQAATVLALLAFRRLDDTVWPDLLAGAALGLAGALKFSAVFLLPSYFAVRLLTPGPRVLGVVRTGLVAVAVLVVFTPVLLWRFSDFADGATVQVAYHYEDRADGAVAYHVMALEYLGVWQKALGWPGTVLSVLGILALARRPRELAPLVLLPLVAVAVLATSDFRRERFLLPALSSAFVLAGAGGALLASRLRGAGAAAALCAAWPFAQSAQWVADVSVPGTRDRVLDFVTTQVPAGARLVSDVPQIGLDGARYEVMEVPRLTAARRLQVLESDYVLAGPQVDAEAVSGLDERFAAEPLARVQGPRVTVYAVPAGLRPPYEPVALTAAQLSASEEASGLPALVDGRAYPSWRTSGPQRAGDWIAADLGREVLLGRVELLSGDDPKFAARELQVLVSQDGSAFREAAALPGRAEDQRARREEPSQVFVLSPPVRARAVKLALLKRGPRRWGVAELKLFAVAG